MEELLQCYLKEHGEEQSKAKAVLKYLRFWTNLKQQLSNGRSKDFLEFLKFFLVEIYNADQTGLCSMTGYGGGRWGRESQKAGKLQKTG